MRYRVTSSRLTYPARFRGGRASAQILMYSILSFAFIVSCSDPEYLGDSTTLTRPDTSDDATLETAVKGDRSKSPFPSDRDLVMIIPQFRAIYPALSIIPSTWLDEVDDALLDSDIGQRISEENTPEDWSLVSIRVSPCTPLGNVADPEEIDQLCWPEVRLVLQPIVQLIQRTRPVLFPEDRAIHALYRVEPSHHMLKRLLAWTQQGVRLADIDPAELEKLTVERDQVVGRLLTSVKQLRVTQNIYHGIAERPEFYDAESEQTFWEALTKHLIEPYCKPDALHHLTAMSLPLGRAPVPLDLWSFVAFNAQDSVLERADLEVKDRESGEVFFNFSVELDKGSEDVSAARADPVLLERLDQLNEWVQERLSDQTILDQTQVSRLAPEIIDPYQTLVVHTTCSSCHRFNDTPFNFHNLSYFGDREISVSPRVAADVQRDLTWIKELITRAPDLL